jgi:hypothetical protein
MFSSEEIRALEVEAMVFVGRVIGGALLFLRLKGTEEVTQIGIVG